LLALAAVFFLNLIRRVPPIIHFFRVNDAIVEVTRGCLGSAKYFGLTGPKVVNFHIDFGFPFPLISCVEAGAIVCFKVEGVNEFVTLAAKGVITELSWLCTVFWTIFGYADAIQARPCVVKHNLFMNS